MLFTDYNAIFDFQDSGHTGKIHNAVSENEKHLGIFIFDVGLNPDNIVFRLMLKVAAFGNNVPFGQPLFKIIPGVITNPAMIPTQDFLTKESLFVCGWESIQVPDGSLGELKQLERIIYSSDSILRISETFVFPCKAQYLGFVIEPFVTSDSFEISFCHVDAPEAEKPVLKVQSAKSHIAFSDSLQGNDTRPYLGVPVHRKDTGTGLSWAKPHVFFGASDSGKLQTASRGVKIKGTDSAVNYSMLIHHIQVSDKGDSIEIYGFNGYTERCYVDSSFSFEKSLIKKLNVVTWSGLLVEWPWASMLWYGEIIYFADLEEFGECCRLYFKEHGDDLCPICGQPLGKQLQYSYVDVMRIPHQLYFCSMDCLHRFNSQMGLYVNRLTAPNNDYILGINL